MNEDFRRQRRNLIAVSLIAIFLNFAAVKLTKLNVLGNDLEISNPRALPVLFGVALAYFLWRYVQFMLDVESLGFRTRFRQRASFHALMHIIRRELRDPNSNLSKRYKGKTGRNLSPSTITLFDELGRLEDVAILYIHKRHGVLLNDHKVNVSGREMILPYMRSTIHVAFRTPLATEYVLPLLLAAIAAISYMPFAREAFIVWLKNH